MTMSRAVVSLVLVALGGCRPTHSGRRCNGALPMPCVLAEVCVYVNARGCTVCLCEEPAYVPLGRK